MLRLLKQRPNRFKYNKSFRNKIYRLSKIKNLIISKISFGTVGVQTLESAKIQYYQIEYFRKALLKYCKNKVKI